MGIRGYIAGVVLLALVGDASASKLLKGAGIALGRQAALRAIERVGGRTLTEINREVGTQLIAKAGAKGAGAKGASKLVPIAGGVVSGPASACSFSSGTPVTNGAVSAPGLLYFDQSTVNSSPSSSAVRATSRSCAPPARTSWTALRSRRRRRPRRPRRRRRRRCPRRRHRPRRARHAQHRASHDARSASGAQNMTNAFHNVHLP